MKEKVKYFRTDDETLEIFENLKSEYKISDGELFKKIVFDTYNLKNETLVKMSIMQEICDKKDKELKALYIKLGELQGELNIYKQQALPKKQSFWKRLFGG
jgi:hypothetical protein